MRFSEVVKAARPLLRESGRIRYRTLPRACARNDQGCDTRRAALPDARELAVEKDGSWGHHP